MEFFRIETSPISSSESKNPNLDILRQKTTDPVSLSGIIHN